MKVVPLIDHTVDLELSRPRLHTMDGLQYKAQMPICLGISGNRHLPLALLNVQNRWMVVRPAAIQVQFSMRTPWGLILRKQRC